MTSKFFLVCLLAVSIVHVHGFAEIVANQLCSFDLITVDLSRDSYIYNVTASMFAIYAADNQFCPTSQPLHIVNAINPDTRFTINGTYCNFQYKSILGRDGAAAAYYTTLHFYARHFNPFTLQPDGDAYPFPVHCLTLQGGTGTTTTGTPGTATTSSQTPLYTNSTGTTASSSATTTTSGGSCGCCVCNCYCPYTEFATHMFNLINKQHVDKQSFFDAMK